MPALTAEQIVKEAERLAGRGLEAAAIFLVNRVKETLSEPAGRRTRVSGRRSRTPGTRYAVATSPATPGAPPRKLTGRLRASVTYQMAADGKSATVGTNVVYARRHELGDHKFLVPTLVANLPALAQIAGAAVKQG